MMNDGTARLVDDTKEKSKQSAWISHWMQTSRNAAAETHNYTTSRNVEPDYPGRVDSSKTGLEVRQSVEGFGVFQTRTFEIMKETAGISSKNDGMSSSLFKKNQDSDSMPVLKPSYVHKIERGKGVHYVSGTDQFPKMIPAAGVHHSLDAGTSRNPLHETYFESSPPSFGQEWIQEMKKYSTIRLSPSQWFGLEKTKSKKKSNFENFSLLPSCVQDVETMRICTTVDSVKGLTGGCPRFSQTTHSLVITKKTDVSLPKENDILRSARVVSKISGNADRDFHCLTPFFGQCNNQGVRLQSLSSSTDTEAKEENAGNVKASIATRKNESSEETDTMDMDSVMEKNLLSGTNSTPSIKPSCYNNDRFPPQVGPASSRDVGCRNPKTGRPDINLELPALPMPATASLLENACPSSSRTQSLEMDTLLAHVEKPARPKSKFRPDDSSETEPSNNRWVKRLKLSSSNSSSQGGIKSAAFPENSSHEKMSRFLSRILKNNITTTEITKPMVPEKSGKEFSVVDGENKRKELLLSHAWIQRWLSNESRIVEKKSRSVVVCQPQSSKLAMDGLQKKQFPSIAAMALMGKAMNGFQQCEVQKRGSFTVWNTKAAF